MTDKILPPEWAIQRAIDILYHHCIVASHPSFNEVAKYQKAYASVLSVAQYVMQHEEAPVDPLLAKAREIAAQHFEDLDTDFARRCAKDLRDGKSDQKPAVQLVLRTLRAVTEEK